MKKILLNILIIFFYTVAVAGNENQKKNKGNPPVNQTNVIDAGDTVVFDLSQQVMSGNYITFPVSFLSDDTIFALDFSLKYDHNNFLYDTILDIAGNLLSYSHYNSTDSTIRYTSSSLQRISNDTALVSIRFSTFSGLMCSPDLNTLKGYLNGELCSVKLITCSTAGIDEINNQNTLVNIYPNPASEFLNIESSGKLTIQLLDIDGRTILLQTIANGYQKINITEIPNGIYMLKVYNSSSVTTVKVVINK